MLEKGISVPEVEFPCRPQKRQRGDAERAHHGPGGVGWEVFGYSMLFFRNN